MKTATTPAKINRFPSIVLGILTALLIVGVLGGLNRAYGISDRTALIALVVIGMALCATGMQLGAYGWSNPFNLVGIVLGGGILALVIAVLAGVQFSFIPDDRAAFTALSALMGIKVVVDVLRALSARLTRKIQNSPAR